MQRLCRMADSTGRPSRLELPWRTIAKILAAAALVWCFLQLRQIILLVVVAVLLAVTLDPVVASLERRRMPRGAAIAVICLTIAGLAVGFVWLTWSALAGQWEYVRTHADDLQRQVLQYLPPSVRDAAWARLGDISTRLGPYALSFLQSAASAVVFLVFGFVLTIYLLVDGRRTYEWLLAFVPLRYRVRAEQTAAESRRVIYSYVAGNVITSAIAAVTTAIGLSLLGVPAALLLAVLAGLSDFVPVVGFIVTSIPAVLLGLTVSPMTALAVAVFYIAYNAVETYILSPWAYGGRMNLSDIAVLLAFVVGAELAGVIGALIALPVAAIYPTIERLWLRNQLPAETVREHIDLETRPAE